MQIPVGSYDRHLQSLLVPSIRSELKFDSFNPFDATMQLLFISDHKGIDKSEKSIWHTIFEDK